MKNKRHIGLMNRNNIDKKVFVKFIYIFCIVFVGIVFLTNETHAKSDILQDDYMYLIENPGAYDEPIKEYYLDESGKIISNKIPKSNKEIIKGRRALTSKNLPASFGNNLKPVYSQGGSQTCWAFASTSMFEYVVDKKTNSNNTSFSVEHMTEKLSIVGNCGFLRTEKRGLGTRYTAGYFAAGYGPVNSIDYPWLSDKELIENYDFGRAEYRATDIQYIDVKRNSDDTIADSTNNIIKNAIFSNGAVVGHIFSDGHKYTTGSEYLGTDNKSYYVFNHGITINHAILIVGWDDNWSKTKFKTSPKSDGAWLVRNSWGEKFGDKGYYWVSYEDLTIDPQYTICDYEQMTDSMKVHNLDEPGSTSVVGSGAQERGFINVFEIDNKEKLKEVTFFQSAIGASCQAFYVPIGESGHPMFTERVAISDTETIDYSGYHTLEVNSNIIMESNSKCGIMIYVKNATGTSIGFEASQFDTIKATANPGESYFCSSTGGLTDITSYNYGWGNFSIKLVTENVGIPITNCTISGPDAVTYSGYSTYSKPVITYQGKQLIENKDYKLTFSNHQNVGTATVIIEGIGDYKGTCIKDYEINKASVGGCDVSNIDIQCYTGSAIHPSITVKYHGRNLIYGTDYGIAYVSCTNVGQARMVLIGLGNFTGTRNIHFNITNDLAYATIEGIYDYEYNGLERPFTPIVKLCGRVLVQNTDYVVTVLPHYTPGNVGIYEYHVIGINKYTGATMDTFSIVAASISNTSITNIADQSYTGSEVTPKPTITFNGNTLVEGVDYSLSYVNNVNKGTATIIIYGMGNFNSSITKTFIIK